MEIEISNGELIDKLTILSLKIKYINEEEKLININKEYEYLYNKMLLLEINDKNPDYAKILEINEKLWEVEDKIRNKEKEKKFDDEFIQLARNVYFLNDERSLIKKEINLKTKSSFIEEKSYKEYK